MKADEFGPGSLLEIDGMTAVVESIAVRGGSVAVTVREEESGELHEISLADAIRLVRLFARVATPRVSEPGDVLDDLPDHARSTALDRAKHVRQIIFGDPDDSDRRYSKVSTTEPQRLEAKAAELRGVRGYSRANLYRFVAAFKSGGVRALAPYQPEGPTGADPRRGLGEATLDVVHRELMGLARHGSTINVQARITRIRRALSSDGIDDPMLTPGRLEAVVRAISKDLRLGSTAKTRRQLLARAARGNRRAAPAFPGERVEVDSTWMNTLVTCPQTGREFRPWICVAVDIATRLTTVRVTPGTPSGRDIRLLLFDVMAPLVLPDHPRPHLPILGVPQSVSVPGFEIGTLVTDNGAEYANRGIVDLCARVGISIELGRTKRGMDKPHVESANRILDIMQQDLPGYVGRSAEHRGSAVNPELSLAALQEICREWAATVYAHRPHSGLPTLTSPGKYYTPMQAYEVAIRRGGRIDVSPHPDDIFGFLESRECAISSDGVHLAGFRYFGDCLRDAVNERITPTSRLGNRRRFYLDTYDRSRIFFRDDDGRWHTLFAIHTTGEAIPAFSDVLAKDLATHLGGLHGRRVRGDVAVAFSEFIDDCATRHPIKWSKDRHRVADALPDPIGSTGSAGIPALPELQPPPEDLALFGHWTDLDDEDDTEDWS
ncbi:integrase catalytic domain-containing protein [Rhodococcus tukisamuensis]|uniref:Integrase core domain-containing protein n=1 Tax=Rhodococcus tukisamuensis TaxID=168276 RepID=A0A1G7DI76_9NOCA|nr:DDE-type integrase/transposase/recombinase [Rhodococcus tukisamuensis]SDE50485.1 Integrase core domain-containing protein [Rhodococcus tukisamuensis]